MKICELAGVREYTEEYSVSLWRDEERGRVVIRAYNEGRNNFVEIDLWDLVEWLGTGPKEGIANGIVIAGNLESPEREALLSGAHDDVGSA